MGGSPKVGEVERRGQCHLIPIVYTRLRRLVKVVKVVKVVSSKT